MKILKVYDKINRTIFESDSNTGNILIKEYLPNDESYYFIINTRVFKSKLNNMAHFSYVKSKCDKIIETLDVTDKYLYYKAMNEKGLMVHSERIGIKDNKSILLIKTDSDGNRLWEKKIYSGHSKESYVNTLGLDQTTDGGCIIAGEKIVSNDKNAWLIKTDWEGTILWDMAIGGLSDEYSCGVEQIDDENYIVVGTTLSYGTGGYDMWLIKVSQGNGTLPPLKPTINGPATGTVNNEYPYTSSTTDPDGDQMYYLWDWDDGSISVWDGPYNSGVTCEATHTWSEKGDYGIKVKAKDTFGAESPWSDPLPISMPYSYNPILQFLELLFERFPHAFPILRQLLRY